MISELKNIDVKTLIPQKFPFVMIDKLIDFSETEITAGLTISEGNLFSHDGFFTEPGLIEHMAQSVALHTGCEYYLRNEDAPTGYIGAIKSVKIDRLPKIGADLETKVTILQEFMGVTLVNIKVFDQNEEIASSEMKTVIAKD